jgi:ADP-ribosylglycohydrolase/fructose-1,6-bisphosphatase/inositol monophosphatase family enzyme
MLDKVVKAVEAQADRLVEEFHRPVGPRGHRGHCDVDREMEEALRAELQGLVPGAFIGEETGMTPGTKDGYTWIVDPHDGTFEFMSARRGSAISVALVKDNRLVLGVVCSPMSPDRGRDTIAWADGERSIRRNGRAVKSDLSAKSLSAGGFAWATAKSALRPVAWSLAVAPARYIAMPSIAYRMARVAAGDGVATVSVHGVNEYDIAAGMALIAAAKGVVLDAEGREIVIAATAQSRVSGVFAGAPQAARQLAGVDWRRLEQEARREPRVTLAFPRKSAALDRAQGVLLGQVIGDSLGSRVEFKSGAEIAQLFPDGVRDLADGGPYHTIAGQPTDDSEMALTLARAILRHGGFDRDKVLDAYREWMQTRPIDIGETTERGLLGLHTTESESNGSLMRVSPIGVWAMGDPSRAAAAARDDSALTHPNPVCVEACAALCAAIAAGVAGGNRKEMLKAALAHCSGAAREAIERNALPESFERPRALTALQNAFYRLASKASLEESLIATVGCGGDTDTNGAVAGALLGALYGRDAFPSRWVLPVLACRPLAEAADPRPRPMVYWPDDVLEVAEALLG